MTSNSIELFDLHGKTGLVTGAARGLGRAMAAGLAGAGADLLLVDLLEDALVQTAGEIRADSGRRIEHLLVNLAVDVIYAYLDRRVVLGK